MIINARDIDRTAHAAHPGYAAMKTAFLADRDALLAIAGRLEAASTGGLNPSGSVDVLHFLESVERLRETYR